MSKKPAENGIKLQGPIRSEGQRLLLRLPGSQADIANAVGAARSAVGFWRRGEKVPTPDVRRKLSDAYGIEVAAWDRKSGSAAPSVPRAATPPPPSDAEGSGGTTLDEVVAELAYLKTQREDDSLSASERVNLSKAISGNLALKTRLERDRKVVEDVLEERVVRAHPLWARVKSIVLGALGSYPEAARSVADALEEAEIE
jgi:transcriptional regulator with XRE-family HTH domain